MSTDKPNILNNQHQGNCDLVGFDLSKDILIQDRYVEENLRLGGAKINVYKLLGIHEQGKLIDVANVGKSISSGPASADYIADNAFNMMCGAWKSKHRGPDVVAKAFIGYDFGEIVDDGTKIYGIETKVSFNISTLVIQQGANEQNRASEIRVERSTDGKVWYGAARISLINDSEIHMYHINGTAQSRYWRIRPVDFLGNANDVWEVNHIELMEYDKTSLDNLQDEMGFLESRDRDYAKEPNTLSAFYDLQDVQSELSQFSWMPSGQNLYFTISFTQAVRLLGRPVVVGDIFEIPSEAQFTHNLDLILKYMEVTDVAWSTEGYTPGWQPTLLRVIAEPMLSSQETLDILGEPHDPDDMGFKFRDNAGFVDLLDTTDRVAATAETNVPERGIDSHEIAEIKQTDVDEYADQGINVSKLGVTSTALYIEDGMPPEGKEYTEGPSYPDNPVDEQYHRLTYTQGQIPPRLYRYSIVKNRWIFCETDRRQQYNKQKPTLHRLLMDNTAVPTSNVTKDI